MSANADGGDLNFIYFCLPKSIKRHRGHPEPRSFMASDMLNSRKTLGFARVIRKLALNTKVNSSLRRIFFKAIYVLRNGKN